MAYFDVFDGHFRTVGFDTTASGDGLTIRIHHTDDALMDRVTLHFTKETMRALARHLDARYPNEVNCLPDEDSSDTVARPAMCRVGDTPVPLSGSCQNCGKTVGLRRNGADSRRYDYVHIEDNTVSCNDGIYGLFASIDGIDHIETAPTS